MENTKNKEKCIALMVIFVIISVQAELVENGKTSELSPIVNGNSFSEMGIFENRYNLENNEIIQIPQPDSLEFVNKIEDGVLPEIVNPKDNFAIDNKTFQYAEDFGSLSEDYPFHRGDMDVVDDYNELPQNVSLAFRQASKQTNENSSGNFQETQISATTISWLESFMFLYRNWQWMLFNTLFMIVWIFFAVFALYRLIGLYWCSLIFSRSLYLVLHLLIFTAATFSIVQLLHLSYGNHQGLPLFLTLLLTHTPSPCLAISCCIVIRSTLAAANVPMYGKYLASLVHVGIFATIVLLFSFIGDVIVGITYSSIILVVFRLSVNTLCILPLILFIYKYMRIRKIHKSLQREFVRELKSLVPSQRSDSREDGIDIRNTLRAILNPWAQLTVFSACCGIVMIFCNFSLSLFFTISNVSLALFWILHSTLFLSQIALVIFITVGATLTLSNVTCRTILSRYFIIPLPKNECNVEPFVQHGNFIYQRVSVNNVPNGGIHHANNFTTGQNEITQNNISVGNFVERPKVSVRRSATFNCPPRAVYPHSPQPYTNPVLSNHLMCTYPIDERVIMDSHNCAPQCMQKNYSRMGNIKPYTKPVSDTDEYPLSPGKFPIMGCNGRSRYGSLHSLPNISPRIRTQPPNPQYFAVNEDEPFIKIIQENTFSPMVPVMGSNDNESSVETVQTGNCVKDIIMENQNLFRSHSLRQSSLRRKIRNRERVSIRTVPSQNGSRNKTCSPIYSDQMINVEKPDFTSHQKNLVSPEIYDDTSDVSFYPRTINDSHGGVENSNFYCQENNLVESNSMHKTDIHLYEPQKISKDLEIPFARSKFCSNDINKDIENPPQKLCSFQPEIFPNNQIEKFKESIADSKHSGIYSDKLNSTKQLAVNSDVIEIAPNEDDFVSKEYSTFTLPAQKRSTLKRNHSSSSFDTQNLPNGEITPCPVVNKNISYGNNWYGTWAGRRSKRRHVPNNDESTFQVNIRKLSASKSSLSNLYEKLKPRKYKSSMTSIDTLDVEESCDNSESIENQLVIVEASDDSEEEETLPKISEDIDLASEILKSSSMLADFLVSRDSNDLHDTDISLNKLSLETSPFEVKT